MSENTVFENRATTVVTTNTTSAAEKETLGRRLNQPQHDSSIFSLLNSKPVEAGQDKHSHDATRTTTTSSSTATTTTTTTSTTTMRPDEYLPTPVTPASGFPSAFTRQQPIAQQSPASSPSPASTSPASLSPPRADAPSPTANSRTPPAKQYTCVQCNQTFSRPHNLKSHLTTHSPERPFQCTVCQSFFRRHHDLKRHEKLHTGEKPFTCDVCQRPFGRLDALNRHRRAQGGTACSAAHRQQTWNNRMVNSPDAVSPSASSAPALVPAATVATASLAASAKSVTTTKVTATPTPTTATSTTGSVAAAAAAAAAAPVVVVADPPAAAAAASPSSAPTTTTGVSRPPHLSGSGVPGSNRPIVPQLHIPHPASQPLGNENYPYPPVVTTSATTFSISASPHNQSPRDMLPSLTRLSTSDTTSFVPIKRRHSNGSSDASPPRLRQPEHSPGTLPSPQADRYRHPHYLAQGWHSPTTPSSDRTLPPPASLRHAHHSPASATPSPLAHHQLTQMEQEIRTLKQQVAYWKGMAEETEQLKLKLHDAEVENKLLRSLIMDTQRSKARPSESGSPDNKEPESGDRGSE